MKHPKLLIATGKTKEKVLKQAKRWFNMNPNRKIINAKTNDGVITLKREDVYGC
jgi:KaiC/GvpD/RAD55 family RecA-like ATPase